MLKQIHIEEKMPTFIKSAGEIRGGSSPPLGTMKIEKQLSLPLRLPSLKGCKFYKEWCVIHHQLIILCRIEGNEPVKCPFCNQIHLRFV